MTNYRHFLQLLQNEAASRHVTCFDKPSAYLNWPHTVHRGEDELVVSQTAVELVWAFPQEVNRHLDSLWSKQLLWYDITSLSAWTVPDVRWKLPVLLGVVTSALPFCACRSRTALKVSAEYLTLSPGRPRPRHQDSLPSASKSLRKHNRHVCTEHVWSAMFLLMLWFNLPNSWLMIPCSQRLWQTESSPEDVTDLITLTQSCSWAFLLPLPPTPWTLWAKWASGQKGRDFINEISSVCSYVRNVSPVF